MVERARAVELVLQVEARGLDADELDRLTRDLLAELQDVPVEARITAGGKPPEGAKSGELVTLGALVVTALPSVLPTFVSFLQSWLKRGKPKSIKIKAANGKRSFAVELPSGSFSHEQLKELLATLGATQLSGEPSLAAKAP
jgi:hypothetical protein